jgi:hypothetical protein
MVNGESGVIGAIAHQSLLTEHNFVIVSVIRQHQNIAESIVR